MLPIANLFLSLAKAFASLGGRQLTTIIGNHNIKYAWRKAKDTDSYNWDDFYQYGNIFFKDKANPVNILPPEANDKIDEAQYIASDKYRVAMRMTLLEQAFDTHGEGLNLMEKLLIVNIVAILIVGAILVVLLG